MGMIPELFWNAYTPAQLFVRIKGYYRNLERGQKVDRAILRHLHNFLCQTNYSEEEIFPFSIDPKRANTEKPKAELIEADVQKGLERLRAFNREKGITKTP